MLTTIIDTDPGIDDVVTLALAARSPELNVVAVTTTYGNATLVDTTRNAAAVLRLAGRPDIPIVPGAARPLSRDLVTAPETHGERGVGYAAATDEPAVPAPGDRPAILEALDRVDAPATLVTLGPLTNLALALKHEANFVRRNVVRHIGMFGNLHERGNTNRWADFNAWCDPEAVAAVLAAGLDTHMVGLDVTRQMTLSAGEVDTLAESADPLVRWLTDALRFYVDFHRTAERLDGCVVNDVLTIGEMLAPGLLAFSRRRLKIHTADGENRGRTVEDPSGHPVAVALDVDIGRMRLLLQRVFGSTWDARQKG